MSNANPAAIAPGGHLENLHLQAEEHPLVVDQAFPTIEVYINHLIHLRAYEEALKLVGGKNVLDVGCNVGYGLQVLATAASNVAGIDVSPQAIAAAQQRLGPKRDVRLYDGVRCVFPSHSFDMSTSFQVIEHISDYSAYFSEIVRLVRPGGTVLFTTPNACIRLDPGMKPWYKFHVREFTPAELRELLERWFDAVEVRGLFGRGDLHQIELNRCERAKIRARAKPAKFGPAVRSTMKRVLPWAVNVRNALRSYANRNHQTPMLDRAELERFSTADLFYRSEGLENALDLIATCRVRQTDKT